MVVRFSLLRLSAIALIGLLVPGTVQALYHGPPPAHIPPPGHLAGPPMLPPSVAPPPGALQPPPRLMVPPAMSAPRSTICLPPGYVPPACPPPVCGPPPCAEPGPLTALYNLVTMPVKILSSKVLGVNCQTASAVPPPGCVPMMPPGVGPLPMRATGPVKCRPQPLPVPVQGAYVPMRP